MIDWCCYDSTLTPFPLQLFTNNGKKTLDTPTRLAAGALAGITSVCPSDPSTSVASPVIIFD